MVKRNINKHDSVQNKNLAQKLKTFGYATILAGIMASCGTDKTDPTKAWERHDDAKSKREQLEKAVADQQKEIREDQEELEKLLQKLQDAKEKERDLRKEAQLESNHYRN